VVTFSDAEAQVLEHWLRVRPVREGHVTETQVVFGRCDRSTSRESLRRFAGVEDPAKRHEESESASPHAGHERSECRLEPDQDVRQTTHDRAGGESLSDQPRRGGEQRHQGKPATDGKGERAHCGNRRQSTFGGRLRSDRPGDHRRRVLLVA
jgi:hypothetical protein